MLVVYSLQGAEKTIIGSIVELHIYLVTLATGDLPSPVGICHINFTVLQLPQTKPLSRHSDKGQEFMEGGFQLLCSTGPLGTLGPLV